jgi:hypothetical protein
MWEWPSSVRVSAVSGAVRGEGPLQSSAGVVGGRAGTRRAGTGGGDGAPDSDATGVTRSP